MTYLSANVDRVCNMKLSDNRHATSLTYMNNLLVNFRRYYLPGSAVFITQVVQDRKPVFRDPRYMNLLREILYNVNQLHPFVMLGYSFLLDHFHIMIQPTGQDNFSDIMHSFKPHFTREFKKMMGLSSSDSLKF